MIKDTVVVIDKIGFHARTASLFAKKAGEFESTVQVSFNDKTVNGKSMLGIMTLGAKSDTAIEIMVDGQDEKQALEVLVDLINNNFNS
ncbi:MAG: HPr family phosphocarrier protein [Maribacter sp.]|nr:HPr family phosphocarrier protein [Maribacter sp.]